MPVTSPFGDVVPVDRPLHDLIMRTVEARMKEDASRKALIDGFNYDNFVTYKQLHISVHAVASYLHSIGFEKKIACAVLPNCFEFPIFSLAVQMQGGGISGASALFTEYELSKQMTDSGCTIVLTDKTHLEKVLKATSSLDVVKKIIVVGMERNDTILPNCIRWDDVMKTPVNNSRLAVPIDVQNDVAILPYSSGTTGSPKGVMLTHRNIGTMFKIYNECMNRLRISNGREQWSIRYILVFMPFYHMYGCALIFNTLLQGDTAVVMSHFDPYIMCKCIQDFKIQSLNVVPPILVMLAKSAIPSDYDLSSLVTIFTGGAPAGRDICNELLKRFPGIRYLLQGYGMTEVSFGSHLPDVVSTKKFGCVGKLAMGYTMKIVDVTNGTECDIGKAGEICVKSPTVMKGYLNRPQETKETIIDGWLHTGDIGYVDSDGDLFIVDRLKELIKVKGLQVPPAELEDLLLSHKEIHDCAVIGVPDELSGELPKAFIVRANPDLTAEQVASFVAEKVSAYKHLKGGVEFVDAIPKSPSGKILRRILRERQKSNL